MSYVKNLKCSDCGKEYSTNQLMNLCPIDNRPLELIIDIDRILQEKPNFKWAEF